MRRNVVGAVGALLATLALVVGVPVMLVLLVGNPWPGRARIEMRDEVAVLVGVLAVVAWLLWARFVVAIAVEARQQLAELRASGERHPTGRVSLTAPPVARQGIGLLAQRLVASALIILPIGTKVAPGVADAPAALPAERAVTPTLGKLVAQPVTARSPARAAPVAAVSITVGPGDTLIGLARTHLGDATRWRELFELNRDREQPDGHRLLSPSGLRVGWELSMPAAPPENAPPAPQAESAVWVAPAVVTVERGDNLWNLTEERLAVAGLPTDDATVAHHLQVVIDANQDIIEDPNLIYVGEQFDFPAIGTHRRPSHRSPTCAPAPVAEQPAPPPVVEQPVDPADRRSRRLHLRRSALAPRSRGRRDDDNAAAAGPAARRARSGGCRAGRRSRIAVTDRSR